MYPHALIIYDEFDCKEHMRELITHCASRNLRTKVISQKHWPTYYRKSLAHHKEPILFYATPSHLHSEDFSVKKYHNENDYFPLILSDEAEVVSFRPGYVDVMDDGQFKISDPSKLPFVIRSLHTEIRKPPVEPITICLLAHKRVDYFKLTYNSIIHSLGEHKNIVPIVIAINGGSDEIKNYIYNLPEQPNIEIIEIEPNTGSAASYFIYRWFKERRPTTKSIILMEDDFILPSAVRALHSLWPWQFNYRLRFFDLVSWLPSLDNLPEVYQKRLKYLVPTDIKITRESHPTSYWLDSLDNENMLITGNALAYTFEFYELVCKTVTEGSVPTDYNFFQIANRICAPKLCGYHIGWNQEQDGYAKLEDLTRWTSGKEATVTSQECNSRFSF